MIVLLAQSMPRVSRMSLGLALLSATLLVIGILFRAACSLYGKLGGRTRGSNTVPEPSLGFAISIVFIAAVGAGMIAFLLGFAANAIIGESPAVRVFTATATMPIGLLLLAVFIGELLDVGFARGLLIALLYVAIIAAVTLACVVVFVAAYISLYIAGS